MENEEISKKESGEERRKMAESQLNSAEEESGRKKMKSESVWRI